MSQGVLESRRDDQKNRAGQHSLLPAPWCRRSAGRKSEMSHCGERGTMASWIFPPQSTPQRRFVICSSTRMSSGRALMFRILRAPQNSPVFAGYFYSQKLSQLEAAPLLAAKMRGRPHLHMAASWRFGNFVGHESRNQQRVRKKNGSRAALFAPRLHCV